MLPTTFRSIWPSCFRLEDFQKSTNQKQELPVAAMFVSALGQNEKFIQRIFHRCSLLSFGSFGKADSEEKIFRNRSIKKQELPVAAILVNGLGQNELSLLTPHPHRCILLSYVHLTKRFQRRRFFRNQEINQSETRIVCGGHICKRFRDKMGNRNRGLFIDAFYQISVHLAKRFQRR